MQNRRIILRHALVAVLLVLTILTISCNREKAIAIQTMAGQLVDASSRIEESLKAYWANYHPPTGAASETEQYLNLASFLVAKHDEIRRNHQGSGVPDKYREAMRRMIKAVTETRYQNVPGLSQVRRVYKRALAVNESVTDLEAGSYFAGEAVLSMEKRLLLIAGDLKELHDLIAEQDAITDEVSVEVGAYFDQAFTNIFLRAGAESALPVDVMAKLIEQEINKGFQLRQSRVDARDELLGRIAVTAGIAVEMAEKTRNYRKVSWSELMGYARDLASLASELELPEKYITGANEALAKVEEKWTEIEAIREELKIGTP